MAEVRRPGGREPSLPSKGREKEKEEKAMTTIELSGVTLILTEKTAEEIQAELNREREERKRH